MASDIAFLREWLERREGGDLFLRGVEAEPWDLHYAADLVVLSDQSARDHFAEYLSDKIVPHYHNRIGQRMKKPVSGSGQSSVWEYKAKSFTCLGNTICMLLSSLIPTVSIFTLYLVTDTVARLVAIAMMSFLFSFVLTFIIGARRVEVFAATTAFAAVQVVFVGGVEIIPTP